MYILLAVSRLSPGPSDRLLIPMQQTRSSVVSPTASSATCQRVSRIRLGTTSLHPRAGSVEAGRAGGGRNAFENRGHATMGRPTHNHQHNTALANRRRSGGIDMERPPSSPATPPPYFGESFASSDPNRAIGGMEMMSRVTSKSSTPAESSNSSNSGSSNARLLPSSASCQQFLTGTNNQFHSRKNAKAAGCKQNRPDGIPLGICYSSDRRLLHDVFSHRLDHHPPHQLRNQKLSSTPSQGTFFQQRSDCGQWIFYEVLCGHFNCKTFQTFCSSGTLERTFWTCLTFHHRPIKKSRSVVKLLLILWRLNALSNHLALPNDIWQCIRQLLIALIVMFILINFDLQKFVNRPWRLDHRGPRSLEQARGTAERGCSDVVSEAGFVRRGHPLLAPPAAPRDLWGWISQPHLRLTAVLLPLLLLNWIFL